MGFARDDEVVIQRRVSLSDFGGWLGEEVDTTSGLQHFYSNFGEWLAKFLVDGSWTDIPRRGQFGPAVVV